MIIHIYKKKLFYSLNKKFVFERKGVVLDKDEIKKVDCLFYFRYHGIYYQIEYFYS